MTDKGYHILRMDILLIQPKINAQPLAFWRQGNGGLDRQAIGAPPRLVYRRVPRQCPRPTTGRLQPEAARIDPDDGHPFLPGFFYSAATPPIAFQRDTEEGAA